MGYYLCTIPGWSDSASEAFHLLAVILSRMTGRNDPGALYESVHSLVHNQLQAPLYRSVVCVVCCHTNNIMPNLRFSQQWCWRSFSCGIWCHVAGWVTLTFPKDYIAFIFKGSWRHYNPSNCLASQVARQGSSRPLTGPEPALGISTMVGREVIRGLMNRKNA
jgi:hypothetical protein